MNDLAGGNESLRDQQRIEPRMHAGPANELARDLGLDSIAEGVESPEVWARLTELGCDEIQGYVLTPPLPPAAFDAWLDDWQLSHDTYVVTAKR